jgi:hypothetical protein
MQSWQTSESSEEVLLLQVDNPGSQIKRWVRLWIKLTEPRRTLAVDCRRTAGDRYPQRKLDDDSVIHLARIGRGDRSPHGRGREYLLSHGQISFA